MNKKTYFSYQNSVRIIAGVLKGRKLKIVNIHALRPTLNIIRETLFNWLLPVIKNSNCLDCFAGSGALGIEALSRNANSVTFIESNKIIARQLKNNLICLNIKNIKLFNINLLLYLTKQYLINNSIKYNIIFIDPPFYKNLVLPTVFLLENNGWLADNSFIYIEKEQKLNLTRLPNNWKLYRNKNINQISYSLYLRYQI